MMMLATTQVGNFMSVVTRCEWWKVKKNMWAYCSKKEIGVEKGGELEKVVVGPKNEKIMVYPIVKTRKKIKGKFVLQTQSVKGGVGRGDRIVMKENSIETMLEVSYRKKRETRAWKKYIATSS
jgi:hypothetical protein